MHPQTSHGWPYDDCTIHVQVRQKNKEMDLIELETECGAFGNVLKIFTWTSKKSATPQAYVLFDSTNAVQRAVQSLNNRTSRLWKNGYHMLRMCESTTEMLEVFFKEKGIGRNDPLFANIAVNKSTKSYTPRKYHALRGEQEPELVKIPTGPRHRPYSLDHRPETSTSARESHPVTFPPKKEPLSPESFGKSLAERRASFGSHTSSKFTPSKSLPDFGQSSPSTKPVPSSPSPVSLGPLVPPPSVDTVDQRQLNLKLQSDIKQLVSDHLDIVQGLSEVKNENENLHQKLQAAEQELARMQDLLKDTEAREKTLTSQLSKAEFDRDGAQDACTQALAAIKDLLANQQNAEAAKLRAEAELQQLREKFAALEVQLAQRELPLVLPKHTAEIGDASSIDPDEGIKTPTPVPDSAHHTLPGKPDLHDIPGFLDAFNDIDKLVMGAFNH
ncbi:hypothetical protein RhiLY_07282 [Ceratobasidium sp. AG-Ba]|nr:hypothetical protein RhiLY_07282 [Ceratobasidium sp. AG-Ba]